MEMICYGKSCIENIWANNEQDNDLDDEWINKFSMTASFSKVDNFLPFSVLSGLNSL